MPTVNHNSGQIRQKVIVFTAKLTNFLVEQLSYELVDFLAVGVWHIFCLLEEVSGGVFQWLVWHNSNIKIII